MKDKKIWRVESMESVHDDSEIDESKTDENDDDDEEDTPKIRIMEVYDLKWNIGKDNDEPN